MKIRRLKISELDTFTKIHNNAMKQLHPNDIKNWLGTKKFFREKTQRYKASIFVAEEKGKIIGFIEGGFYVPKPHHTVEIYSLFVKRGYRDKGTEEMLAKKFISAHKSKGFKTIWITDFSYLTIRFYERLGFKKTHSRKSMGLSL